MGIQSIVNKDIWTFRQELLEKREKNVNKLILKDAYALGEGYCEESQEDISYLLEMISMNDKGVNSLIGKLLKGEDISKKCDNQLPETYPKEHRGERIQNYVVDSEVEEHDHEHILFNTLPTLPTI